MELTRRTPDMAHIDPLLRRNKDFAATSANEKASIIARYPVYVITCLDPRTDPSAFLGLELGDAMVIRNAGGRVSPDVLKDLAYICYLARMLVPAGPRFEVAFVVSPVKHRLTPGHVIRVNHSRRRNGTPDPARQGCLAAPAAPVNGHDPGPPRRRHFAGTEHAHELGQRYNVPRPSFRLPLAQRHRHIRHYRGVPVASDAYGQAAAPSMPPVSCVSPRRWIRAGAAGVVRGHTMTSWPSLRTDIRNVGPNALDEQVITDRNITSSR
jgi:hypothetical protein